MYIHITEYGTQIRSARGKAKYSLARGQRRTQPCDATENLSLSCTYFPYSGSPQYRFRKTVLLHKMQYTLPENTVATLELRSFLFLWMLDIQLKVVCFISTWILALYLCSEEINRWDIKFSLTWQIFDLQRDTWQRYFSLLHDFTHQLSTCFCL